MEINANTNLTIQITGGPAISASWTIAADAFDRSTMKILQGGHAQDVLLQPAGGDKVLLLLITASKYTDKLVYKLDAANPDFKMTQPQLVSGPEMLHTLSATPSKATFTNTDVEDITVDLFVLRQA